MQLAQTCEKLGAGEILLNCIDKDGTNSGFDIELINHIRENVAIPVIASSGAVFHREEEPIAAVKEYLRQNNIETR